MKAIVAMAQNRAIGKNGGLPWPSIKEDFKWFKEFTMGQRLIVGWNTFNTLPKLKGRRGVVLDKRWDNNIMYSWSDLPFDGFCLRNPLGIWDGEKYGEGSFDVNEFPDAIVAGGAKTYEFLLPHITELYVTHVHGEYEADTFMPPFEHLFTHDELIKEFDKHMVVKYSK